MKLRNKKTGEIINSKELLTDEFMIDLFSKDFNYFNSKLGKICKEWEDYEEPTGYWYIDFDGEVLGCVERFDEETEEQRKEIGNYFETREEAEKAVEKLKAWKRLKDKGFRFEGIKQDYTRFFSQQKPIRIGRKYLQFNKAEDEEWLKENGEDLDLLFGGKE